jgi:KDO2-lipid IV(A) lauroyltransferase
MYELIPEDDRVRDVRPLVRLYASKNTHRLMPAPVALALLTAVGTPGRQHNKAAELRSAERLMKDLLLHTSRAGEAGALARRNVAEVSRLRELFWRPWLLKRSRVFGEDHWETAHAGGRGCVVVVGHFGAMFAVTSILGRHGFDLYSVASRHYWQPMPPGFRGLMTLHLRTEYAEALGTARLIPSDARPERLIELVESGASVLIAFDVPGSAATPFLGRSVALTGVPATLAFRTGANVLPMIPERHGSRIDLRILEPLDPTDYRDSLSLRVAIARIFELIVLEKPEMVDFSWYPSPLVTETLTSQIEGAPEDEPGALV